MIGQTLILSVTEWSDLYTLNLMSKNNAMNDLINRKKIGDALKGTQGLMLNGNKKMARPNTEKWNDLISLGYVPLNKELV